MPCFCPGEVTFATLQVPYHPNMLPRAGHQSSLPCPRDPRQSTKFPPSTQKPRKAGIGMLVAGRSGNVDGLGVPEDWLKHMPTPVTRQLIQQEMCQSHLESC